jgi:ABC-type nickel/cobalt efflux system permease component RcnA
MKRSYRQLRPAVTATALLASVIGALLMPARPALAHPLGNFSVNHYSRIEMAPTQAQIYYVVDIAEIPTFQLRKKIDANKDGQIQADEHDAYVTTRAEEIRQNVALTVNGSPIALTLRAPEMRYAEGQGGLQTSRLTFWLDGTLPPLDDKAAQVEFLNNNESDRLGWREIIVRAKDGLNVSESSVSGQDVSDELRIYPEDMLSQPLRQTTASFKIALIAGAPPMAGSATTQRPVFGSSSSDAGFAALINYRDLTPAAIALALLTAIGLGALHALEPGHGKGVAAAYLVGARATPRHAILLGATITVTHTFSVYMLGLVTVLASSLIVPEKLFPYLGLVSALIVIVVGLNMIRTALRDAKHTELATDHVHDFDPNTGELAHSHGDKAHSHVPPSKLNSRNVLAVGISGGLVPCPAGLIVMLSAIALGRIAFGFALIVAFSLGLAAVITGISLAIVFGKRAVGNNPFAATLIPKDGRVARMLPFFSGVLVIIAGLLLFNYVLPFLQLL